MHINVIGAGLAGCEAAMQIASCGIKVHLYEMKPNKKRLLIILRNTLNLFVQILLKLCVLKAPQGF